MKITLKRALSVILALCVLVATATCLMGVSVFAEDTPESTLISQIDESLAAEKARVVCSRQESGTPAYNAFDGNVNNANENQWWANSSTGYIVIDLGAMYNITSIEVYARYKDSSGNFFATNNRRTYTYDIYALPSLNVDYAQSNNTNVAAAMRTGAKIVTSAQNSLNKTHTVSGFGRYVMIDVTAATGTINMAEIQVFGYEPTVTTSTNNGNFTVDNNIAYNYISGLTNSVKAQKVLASNQATKAYLAFDNVASPDNENKWYSSLNPTATNPDYLIIDLGAVYNLTGITMNVKTDRTHTYSIYTISNIGDVAYTDANKENVRDKIINDGTQIVAQTSHKGTKALTVNSEGRYVLVYVTASGTRQATNIEEMEIFGYSIASSFAIDEEAKTITVPDGFGLTVKDILDTVTVNGNAYASIKKATDDVITPGDFILVNHKETATTDGLTAYQIKFDEDNLALGKPVLGHGQPDKEGNPADGNPALAVDGELTYVDGTQWMVGGTAEDATDRPWLIIDLGDVYNLTSLMPYFVSTTGYDYYVYTATEIAYEWNNDNKKAIAEAMMANAPAASDTTKTLGGSRVDLSATARYVLVKFGNRLGNASNTLSVYELDIFGYKFAANELLVDDADKTITVPYSFGTDADKILADLVTENMVAKVAGSKLELTVHTSSTTTKTVSYDLIFPSTASVIAGMSVMTYSKSRYVTTKELTDGSYGNGWMDNYLSTSRNEVWVMIDMGADYTLSSVKTTLSPGSIGKRRYYYDIYVVPTSITNLELNVDTAAAIYEAAYNAEYMVASVREGANAATNTAACVPGGQTLTFAPTTGRYLLLKTEGTHSNDASDTFNIPELEAFGYALTSTEASVYETNKQIALPLSWGDNVTAEKLLSDIKVDGNAYITVEADGKYLAEGDKLLVHYYTGTTIEYAIVAGKPDGSQVNVFKPSANGQVTNFYNSDDNMVTVTAEADTKVTFSFEYYTATTKAYQPGVSDSKVGMYLPAGRNKFTQTYTLAAGETATPYIKSVAASAEPLYVWNVVITVDDVNANVTYQGGNNVTYSEMATITAKLGINPDKEYITRVDYTSIDEDSVTSNIYAGLMNSVAYLPTEDNVKNSYSFYLPGNTSALYVYHSNGVNVGLNGNYKQDKEHGGSLVIGQEDSIQTYGTKKQTGDATIFAAIRIDGEDTYRPDFAYFWNFTMKTTNYGTVTFLEHGGLATAAGASGITATEIVLEGNATSTIFNDKVFTPGDVNDDGEFDVRDLVYMSDDTNTFKDVRTYGHGLYGMESYQMAYVRGIIWDKAFDEASLDTLIGYKVDFTVSEEEQFHATKYSSDIYVGQGACVDNDGYAYFAIAASNATVKELGIVIKKYDLATKQCVATSEPLIGIGKANDLTYNSKLNLIIAVYKTADMTDPSNPDNTKEYTLIDPDTLKVVDTVYSQVGASGISYNAKTDRYLIGGGNTTSVVDADFKLLYQFVRDREEEGSVGYTSQGVCCDDNYIYYIMSGSSSIPYKERDNIIIVRDWQGNYVTTVTVPNYNEGEAIFFYDGNCYISYNAFNGAVLQKLNFTVKSSAEKTSLPKAEGSDLRVMSYNILAQKYAKDGATAASRINFLNDVLTFYAPDVIGLNEVDEPWHTEIDKLLNANGVYKFACKYTKTGLMSMTTMLYNSSTVKLIEEYSVDLLEGSDIRVFSVAVFEKLSDGQQFVVTHTHPDPSSRTPVYLEEMAKLVELLAETQEKYQGLPLLITGDFNTRESQTYYADFIIDTGLKDAKYEAEVLVKNLATYSGERGKLPTTESNAYIDHIFVNKGIGVKLFDVITDYGIENCSDHLPIYADLTFK